VVFVSTVGAGVKKVAFLVGAGLSKSAHLPTSVELAEHFKERIQQSADGSKAPVLLKHLHYYIEGGIRLQRAKLGQDPSTSVNIEDIAIAVRRLQTREQNPLAPFVSGWHPHLVEMLSCEPLLLDKFLDVLFDHIQAELGSPQPEAIAFLDRLADIAIGVGGLDIFSLNYDLCIEKALAEKQGFRLIDGFDTNGWRLELFREDGPNLLRLYKLHGSLDWVDAPESGLISLSKVDPETAAELEGLPPHLVFGTDVKLTVQQPFFSLAHLLFEALCRINFLVVIGYGFGDEYINSLIDQCMRINRRLRLLVIDPYAEQIALRNPQLVGSNPNVYCETAYAKDVIENHGLRKLILKKLQEVEGDPF
jgi:hypothetical protein